MNAAATPAGELAHTIGCSCSLCKQQMLARAAFQQRIDDDPVLPDFDALPLERQLSMIYEERGTDPLLDHTIFEALGEHDDSRKLVALLLDRDIDAAARATRAIAVLGLAERIVTDYVGRVHGERLVRRYL